MTTQKRDFCPEMLSALLNANSILLCTHIAPDGDAIGSTLALGLALKGLGKSVVMVCADPAPGQFRFLPGAGEMVTADALGDAVFDAAIAVDAASLARVGACQEAFLRANVRLQLDHHPDNPLYADYNWVDGHASAAGCVVRRMMKKMNADLTPEIAACLYCAISTDTGNFRFQNTSEEAFSIMAELMAAGLDLPRAARPLHQLREAPHVRLLGRALCSLRFFGDGRCAGMRLTRADYAAAQALPEHNTGIVNYALDIPGVEMAYLAEERENGEVKASLRSLPPWDIAAIARKHDGGGHMFAAGLRYDGALAELCDLLEKEMLALRRQEQAE